MRDGFVGLLTRHDHGMAIPLAYAGDRGGPFRDGLSTDYMYGRTTAVDLASYCCSWRALISWGSLHRLSFTASPIQQRAIDAS